MRAQGEAHARVIGLGVLARGGHGQRHPVLAHVHAVEQRQLPLDALDRPARAVAVPGQPAQRAGVGQQRALAGV